MNMGGVDQLLHAMWESEAWNIGAMSVEDGRGLGVQLLWTVWLATPILQGNPSIVEDQFPMITWSCL